MLDDFEIQKLYAEAVLGEQIDRFFRSDEGRYVLQMAVDVEEKNKEKLAQVDPEDVKEIRRLQNEIGVATQAIKWLNEAIEVGRDAKQALEYIREEQKD